MAFGSIYTGSSGLLAFSKALDLISNNVANMNTPGYKGSDLLFRDFSYSFNLASQSREGQNAFQLGTGVSSGSTSVRFLQGDFRDTGIDTDLAIDGFGFFILKEGNKTFYTRAGQFTFNDDGVLVTQDSDAKVMGINDSGQLSEISILGLRTNPAKATSEVTFEGNLSTGSSEHTIENVELFDSLGEKQNVTVKFTNNSSTTPRSWLVEVTNEDNDVIGNGEIRFQANGTPETDFNSVTFTFAPENAEAKEVTFSFGDPGEFDGATSFSGGESSDLRVKTSDGFGVGILSTVEFDEQGVFTLNYTNEQSTQGSQIALAWFNDLQTLRRGENARFIAQESQEAIIGRPNENVFGTIKAGSIELSNVDLTQEITDLIVVQRGFQTSSQVITITSELIETLIQMDQQ